METVPKNDSNRWMYISVTLILVVLIMGGSFVYIYIDLVEERTILEERLSELQMELNVLNTEVINLKELMRDFEASNYNRTVFSTAAQIYNLTQPSVVSITVKPNIGGTGFVYDTLGHIITNNHVVESEGAIRVTFADGEMADAQLVGRDPYSDLAVLKVDLPPNFLRPLPLGNSSELVVGEKVYAMGNPFGLSGSITEGIISQLGRQLMTTGGYSIVDVIQIDAAINPGNSGGPLLNVYGEVIGVNTAIATRTGTFSGVGFAIPSDLVRKVVPSLILKGEYKHPWVGISGLDVTPEIAEAIGLREVKGFLVITVVEGSPAENAGIRGGDHTINIEGEDVLVGGDIVTGIDGREVRNILDILVYLERYKEPGDGIVLTVLRDGELIDIPLTLGERP